MQIHSSWYWCYKKYAKRQCSMGVGSHFSLLITYHKVERWLLRLETAVMVSKEWLRPAWHVGMSQIFPKTKFDGYLKSFFSPHHRIPYTHYLGSSETNKQKAPKTWTQLLWSQKSDWNMLGIFVCLKYFQRQCLMGVGSHILSSPQYYTHYFVLSRPTRFMFIG